MGENQFITKEQQVILDEVKRNSVIQSQFYFTGGTALSLLYLHHRYSDDLDFFSETKLDNQVIFSIIETWSKKYHFTFQSRFAEVVYVFNLLFKDGSKLKVDFAYYPYHQIEKKGSIDGLWVDSFTDIAVNKLLTISQRTDVKDFVDLYFLLEKFSLWDLIEGMRIKFRMKIEPFLLASDFLKVEDFQNLPQMIAPLTLKELKLFFRKKAKEVGRIAIKE